MAIGDRAPDESSEPPDQATQQVEDAGALLAAAPPALGSAPRYEILHPHASGGLADIYVARDLELGRTVAVKRLKPEHQDRANVVRRFLREAEITGRLEHPGVVPVHGLGRDATGQLYYAMRFVEGQNLRVAITKLHAAGPFQPNGVPFRQLMQRFVQVCNTVAYAHSTGILHRDIKPQNIIAGRYGEVLLVDWGLAKPLSADPHPTPVPRSPKAPRPEPETVTTGSSSSPTLAESTRAGAVLGTPAFMSPEQADADWNAVGPATDIYGLGATLYTLVCGQPPFAGNEIAAILRKVRGGEFVAPRTLQRRCPRDLEAIVLKAMALCPANRYLTVSQLTADLEKFLADEPITARRATLWDGVRRWMVRQRTLATLALATLMAAVMAQAISQQVVVEQQRSTAVSMQATQYALLATDRERAQARAERDRADANFRIAQSAVDAALRQIADHPRLREDDLVPARKELLRAVLPRYAALVEQAGGAVSERAASRLRLAQLRAELGDAGEAMQECDKAETLFVQAADAEPNATGPRQRLASFQVESGQLAMLLARPAVAERAFRNALAAHASLPADVQATPPEVAARATAQTALGMALIARGQPADAERALRAGLSLLATLPGDWRERADILGQLGDTHQQLARALKETQQWQAAENALRESLVERQRALEREPRESRRRADVASSHFALGNLLMVRHHLRVAAAEYQQAIALCAKLAAEYPIVSRHRRSLALAHNALGVALLGTKQFPEAERELAEATRLFERLVSDFPKLPDLRREQAATFNNEGLLYARRDQPALAEVAYKKAAAVQDQLAVEFPQLLDIRRDLATTQRNIATVVTHQKRLREAEMHLRASLAQRQAVHDQAPADGADTLALGQAVLALADVLVGRGDASERLGLYGRAAEAFAALPAETGPGGRRQAGLARATEQRALLAVSVRHSQAVTFAVAALAVADEPRLHAVHARALAQAGRRDETRVTLAKTTVEQLDAEGCWHAACAACLLGDDVQEMVRRSGATAERVRDEPDLATYRASTLKP